MNKKVIIYILGCLIMIFIFLFFIYETNLLMMFKKSESLNYHKDIDYIIVTSFKGDRFIKGYKNVVIRDSNDIEKIFDFLNSLKLVKGKGPRHYIYDEGSFGITVILKKRVSDFNETFFFMSDYLVFDNELRKSDHVEYYIKDSEYNSKDKTNKIYYFLYDIINKQ